MDECGLNVDIIFIIIVIIIFVISILSEQCLYLAVFFF